MLNQDQKTNLILFLTLILNLILLVLGLVSREGVETVLLRIELLIEGGLDKQVFVSC